MASAETSFDVGKAGCDIVTREQAQETTRMADGAVYASVAPVKPVKAASTRLPWNRKNPYRATVLANDLLSGPESAKEVRHYSLSLGDSGITYQPGDGLGVKPVNNPELVDALIGRLGVGPDTTITVKNSQNRLDELLTHSYEIGVPSVDLIEAVAARTGDAQLRSVLEAHDRATLQSWAWGKDVLDVLAIDGSLALDPVELLGLLRPLQHRVYSISSSPLTHQGTVDLTVASVRYRSAERDRGGVCSTFLADRLTEGETAGVFLTANKSFRLPADDAAPVIMVGPGTGVAPFRAFLHDRRAREASGRNWLFFGDQHRGSDFIYEDELRSFSQTGVLTRLDLAFSRDQSEKIYVQHRMRESGKELYSWLEEGAHFYVCGGMDMGKDVDSALREILVEHGGLNGGQAEDYVAELRSSKRYLRDVY